MKAVFLDTGAFFAHVVEEDTFHARAVALFAEGIRERWWFYTTSAAVYETYTLLTRRIRGERGRLLGLEVIDTINSGFCEVVRVTSEDEAQAVSILRGAENKSFSYFDALSFVVMERLGIRQV